PRLNLQSILTRHFLTRSVFGDVWNRVMGEEFRFAAAMSWLKTVISRGGGQEEYEAVMHALKRGADNAEGLEIPRFVVELFAQLPMTVDSVVVLNYIEQCLHLYPGAPGPNALPDAGLNVFRNVWATSLNKYKEERETLRPPVSVLEPACGSA